MEAIGGMKEKKLNWFKVIMAIVIVIILVAIIIILIIHNSKIDTSNLENLSFTKEHIFIDKNNSISLDIPTKYKLSKFESSSERVLELKSPDNLYVLVSYDSLYISGKSIVDFITKDREIYLANYKDTSNISDVVEENINNLNTYSYSFDYTNSNKHYTLETIWIESDYGYYIIDINYLKPEDDVSNQYEKIRLDVLNGFSFIENNNDIEPDSSGN